MGKSHLRPPSVIIYSSSYFILNSFCSWALQVVKSRTNVQPKEKHDIVIFKINDSETATTKTSQIAFTVRALQS